MSAFCPEGCPDADACVVGYPCALFPGRTTVEPDEESPEAYGCRCGGDPAHPRSERCGP